eukprot:TRINITY_DN26405_c0_g1_i1.p2 TRINITY_DN26405_c0_g1~~TRINITY_DN26405_c0_g1_i1.p2  ORF type:complete len:223 (+),score=-27.97 TRINITY_DN26405_c0_g1_i1:595-1263(+)
MYRGNKHTLVRLQCLSRRRKRIIDTNNRLLATCSLAAKPSLLCHALLCTQPRLIEHLHHQTSQSFFPNPPSLRVLTLVSLFPLVAIAQSLSLSLSIRSFADSLASSLSPSPVIRYSFASFSCFFFFSPSRIFISWISVSSFSLSQLYSSFCSKNTSSASSTCLSPPSHSSFSISHSPSFPLFIRLATVAHRASFLVEINLTHQAVDHLSHAARLVHHPCTLR